MTDVKEPVAVVEPAASPEPQVTAPKKRGRPAKNPPADGVAAPVSDDGKNTGVKPGRPKKKGKVHFTGDDISSLGKQIQGLHHIAAIATGIPELAVSEDEAQMLGGALATVAQEYDLELSGKTGAMLQLLAVCGMIYVPKFITLKKRVTEAQARHKANLHVIGGTDSTTAD